MSAISRIKRNCSELQPQKSRRLRLSAIAAACVFLATAGIGMLRAGQQAGKAATTGAAFHGVDLEIMDTTCKPCEDFYHYASGSGWPKIRYPPPIPAGADSTNWRKEIANCCIRFWKVPPPIQRPLPVPMSKRSAIFMLAAWMKSKSTRWASSLWSRKWRGSRPWGISRSYRRKLRGCRRWVCAPCSSLAPRRMQKTVRR